MTQTSVVRSCIRLAHEEIRNWSCMTSQSRDASDRAFFWRGRGAPTWVSILEYCRDGGYAGYFGIALLVDVEDGGARGGRGYAGGDGRCDAASDDGTDGEAGNVDEGCVGHRLGRKVFS